MNESDEARIVETLRRYYRAHAHDVFAEQDVYEKVKGDLLAILDEELLQRVLVEELGGDTLEQAFYEGQLFHPEEHLNDAAALSDADYEVRVEGEMAEASVEGATFDLRRTDDGWKIRAFR
jgi:hypothetical protein